MTTKIFTADDFGKYKEGNNIILKSGLGRVSVIVTRCQDFSGLEGKQLGMHADFGGENLCDFLFLFFRRKFIEQELNRQIEKFIKIFGKIPAHLDSHRYLHLHPFVFPIFLSVCKKYKIPYLRMSRCGVAKISNLTSLIIHWLIKLDYFLYKKQIDNFVIADYLISLDWYKKIDFELPEGVIKIIFHPENDIELFRFLQNS